MITIRGQIEGSKSHLMRPLDLAVVACGYETRARTFVEQFGFGDADKYALVFEEQRVLAFDENLHLMREKGFRPIDITDRGVKGWLLEILDTVHNASDREVRVFVDISSQSRVRLAGLIEALDECAQRRSIRVYFGYSPARFSPPPIHKVPNVSIGPVSPFFAGWTKDPDLPVSLVLGLGYEPDRALGAVEYLEPASVWALMPHSREHRYDTSLRKANMQLLEQVGRQQVLTYEVEDPNATLAALAALITHLARNTSVLLLPSGPKILVLLSLLIACDRPDVSVWRVSAGANDVPIDRLPTNVQLVVECEFSPGALELAVSGTTLDSEL